MWRGEFRRRSTHGAATRLPDNEEETLPQMGAAEQQHAADGAARRS
jgi:hypothetical protein